MAWRRAAWVGVFALLVCAAAALQAQAQPPPLPPRIAVQLDYVLGPRGAQLCTGRSILRAALRSDFGYDIVRDDAAWRLVVAVNPGPGRTIEATMELRDPAGSVIWKDTKRVINNDCHSLISGVALAVRIGIERRVAPIEPKPEPAPELALAKPEPAPEPPAPVVPEPAPVRRAPAPVMRAPAPAQPPKDRPAPETSAPPWNRPRLRAGIGTTFASGGAPIPTLGLAVQLGVRWPIISMSLEGRGDMPGEEDGLSAGRISGSVLPCGHYMVLFGCAVGTAGRQSASYQGENDGVWFVGGGARVGVEVPFVGVVALRLSGDLVATTPIRRMKVGIVDRWTSPTLSGVFGAGLVADF